MPKSVETPELQDDILIVDENNIDSIANEKPQPGEPGKPIRLTDDAYRTHEESIRKLHNDMTNVMERARNGEIPMEEADTQWDRMDSQFKEHRQALDGHARFMDSIHDYEKKIQDRAEALNRIPGRARNAMIGGGRSVSVDDVDFRELHERQSDTLGNYQKGMVGWFKAQNGVRSKITSEEIEAAQSLGFNPMDKSLFVPLLDNDAYQVVRDAFLAEMDGADSKTRQRNRGKAREAMQNALHTGTGGGENALFGTTFIGRLEEAVLAYEGLINSVDVIRTPDGSPYYAPTANDTANEGKMLTEADSMPPAAGDKVSNVVPTFSRLVLNAYIGTSDLVAVSNSLLEDNDVSLARVLPEMLGKRIGRLKNKKGTVGTGTNEPNGLATAAADSGVTIAVASIAFANLIDLQHEIDPAIRENMDCKYMAHDQTIKALKKLVDSEGRPLWMVDYRNGAPDTIDGYGYIVNQNMAQMAADAISVLFGSFMHYKWRDVVGPGSNAGMRLKTLRELYAESDQTAYAAFCRFDGDLMNAGDDPVQALIHPSA